MLERELFVDNQIISKNCVISKYFQSDHELMWSMTIYFAAGFVFWMSKYFFSDLSLLNKYFFIYLLAFHKTSIHLRLIES